MLIGQHYNGCAVTTPTTCYRGKMNHKTVTLLSSNDGIDDERWYWNILLKIRRDGTISNTGHVKARQTRAYYIEHQELIRQHSREWGRDNPGRRAEYGKAWRRDNPEAYKRIGDQNSRRQISKRRGMGFAPLNECFDGAHAHHVNNDQVIYVPADLHNSIRHNLQTGQGMQRMNALAFQYLFKHT